jgi:hypothetical protein
MSRRISDASWADDDFAIPSLRIFEPLGSRGSRDGLLEPGDGRGRATDGRLRAGAEAPRATAPLPTTTLRQDLGPSVGGATISGYRQEAIKLSICERLPIDVGMPTKDERENANARVP